MSRMKTCNGFSPFIAILIANATQRFSMFKPSLMEFDCCSPSPPNTRIYGRKNLNERRRLGRRVPVA